MTGVKFEEGKGSEIVCALYCCRKSYISVKHNVKLQPTHREYTAEKSGFSTRSHAYKQLDTSSVTFICIRVSVSFQSNLLFKKWW